MKHSQKSNSSAGPHKMTVVLFTCVLICGSLSLSLKAQTKTSDEHVTENTVPGRNGKIAFTSTRDGNSEIYTMEADGSNQTRLTNNLGNDVSPKWSPNSTKIAFASSRDDTSVGCTSGGSCKYEIYVMNADGTNQTRTNNPVFEDFDWSPDGTRIVFESIHVGSISVSVMNADGSNVQRLTNYPGLDLSPKWSPDGTKIAFVRADDWFDGPFYLDFLNREPDAPGWVHWTSEITECLDPTKRQPGESVAACTERKRANTSAAFFLSPEFQNTGSFVLRVYWGTLGKLTSAQCPGVPQNLPGHCRPRYNDYITDMNQVAQGIVVNDKLDPAVINANKHAFVDQFVNRPEFKAAYPDALSNQAFVDKLFQTTGVTPSSTDRQALIDGLNGGTETRSSVVFKVVDGTETVTDGALVFQTFYGQAFYDKEFDAAFVFMEYIGYLRRNPDQEGYDFWLAKLKRYGNWVDAQMVLAFIISPEYRSRFGP
jgi:WD40-like Beta Propeller Repeat/Domain of unknown function (DUF4214)